MTEFDRGGWVERLLPVAAEAYYNTRPRKDDWGERVEWSELQDIEQDAYGRAILPVLQVAAEHVAELEADRDAWVEIAEGREKDQLAAEADRDALQRRVDELDEENKLLLDKFLQVVHHRNSTRAEAARLREAIHTAVDLVDDGEDDAIAYDVLVAALRDEGDE